jgi:dienelactone hydrolase
MNRIALLLLLLVWNGLPAAGADEPPLAGTTPLDPAPGPDRSTEMVAGIDRYLMRALETSVAERPRRWHRDLSSASAHEQSVETNRVRLRRDIGAVDPRLRVDALEYVSSTLSPALVAENDRLRVWAVRWPVFEGVFGEGLLLEPRSAVQARVVAVPDADQTPEMISGLEKGVAPESQFARRLAEAGCQVLVPTVIDRRDLASGNAHLNRFTNQPHREWIYRQAFELGRHIIGYEVQKILSAVDWFARQNALGPDVKLGVAGYGEGGLLALDAAALDTRISAVLVSGYFESRQRAWMEPIYRNVFDLLSEFGDAELATLVAPRRVVVEHSESPRIDGPPPQRPGRGGGAAPGRWQTPEYASVDAEVRRAQSLLPADWARDWIHLVNGSEGGTVPAGSSKALVDLLNGLGLTILSIPDPGPWPLDQRKSFDPDTRQKAQVQELVDHTQRLLRLAESVRDAAFLKAVRPGKAEEWKSRTAAFRDRLWDDVIGRLPPPSIPANPRTRLVHDRPAWRGYDVVLDVWPDVFAWGELLLPRDIKPGERRPVVVCQHGLESLPWTVIDWNPSSEEYRGCKGYASQLAERGFVVFAPHNPYRGGDRFRVLQRKANLLGKSLFSIITAQHDRILEWLASQPFVDPDRMAFYGISYGGKTAMRVPALLDRYCLSICSADFNEWILKNATVDSPYSYLLGGEYEMPEFNLGNTFNYAEMAALIAPRPFMVERGHDDGVAPDEWVSHEYARVRRLYTKLGIPERTEIEFFNGPHSIHAVGTFEFLHRHLHWPRPGETVK